MASRDPLEEEFREFVAARSAALLRTAYLLAGDWATAEDLLQTALTKTYLAWKRLGGIEAVEPYARRVLVNTSTSWWRRRWHGERPTEVLPERAGADEIERAARPRRCSGGTSSALPARQRAVLVLRFYEDMSEAQTAALLDISPGTVKSQTSRALATLRRRLGADAPELPAGSRGPPARPLAGRRPVGPGRRPTRAPGRRPGAPPTPTRARPAPRPAVPRPSSRPADLPGRPAGRCRSATARRSTGELIPGRPDNPTGARRVHSSVTPGRAGSGRCGRPSPAGSPSPLPLAADPAGLAIRRANRIRRRRSAGRAGPGGGGHGGGQRRHGPARRRARSPRTPTVVLGDPYAVGAADRRPVGRPRPARSGPLRRRLDLIVGDDADRRAAASGWTWPASAGRPGPARPDHGGWLVRRRPTAAGRYPLGGAARRHRRRCCWPGPTRSRSHRTAGRSPGATAPTCSAAGLVGGQLIATVRTPAPAAAVPVGFVGDEVLVRLDPASAGYALWRPAPGS